MVIRIATNWPQVAEGGSSLTHEQRTDMDNTTNIPNEEQSGRLQQPAVGGSAFSELVKGIRLLNDDQRLELFSDYCAHCGRYDGDTLSGCQCWNDD